MDPKCLTIVGLVFDIVGVAVVLFFAWPQPELESGVGLGLEDGTPISPNGETVADRNRRVERRRILYKRGAIVWLLFLLAGFGLQPAAQFV
jgi:hypothetical protein